MKKGNDMNISSNFIGEVNRISITTLVDDNSGFNSPYLGQHGFSLLLDITSGNIRKRILFDTGQSGKALLYNVELLKINLDEIDMVILSHCHYDHTGGLVEILKEIKKEIPVIAHPKIFRHNYCFEPYLRNLGMTLENSEESIGLNGGKLLLSNEKLCLMKGVVSTGEVTRVIEFEDQGINTFNIEEGKLVSDFLMDDLSLVINIRNKGLLVISGCSHAGIINIIKHAIQITGIEEVYGIVGGLHLLNASDIRIDKTIEELLKMNIKLVAAGHCTGLNAQYKLSKSFIEYYEMLHSGKRLEINDF